MLESQIDQVLQKLDTLLDRVDVMDISINKFNERLGLVEDKVESFGFEVNKLHEEKAATTVQINELTTNVNNLIEDLEKRLKDYQKQILENRTDNRKDTLRNEMYSKRFNILIHCLKENGSKVWETKEATENKVHKLINEALGIANSGMIKFVDVHRWP